MKWLAVIWAFYLMALSVVPCSDAHNVCNSTKPAASAEPTHHHSQDKDDICPPFCHCSCCSMSIALLIPSLPAGERPLPGFTDKKVFIRNFSFLSCYYGNIWQPPKINA